MPERRLPMNISQPIGPRNRMITSHPHLGPMGQLEPGGARQGPLFGDTPT